MPRYLAIYVAQQCGKQTLGQSVANCMGVLARLDELRVVPAGEVLARSCLSN